MATKACQWALATNRSQSEFGVTVGGEFSAAIKLFYSDCGLWLNGISSVQTNPNCDYWDDSAAYNSSTVVGLEAVILATLDGLQDFFFWTWKIGESTNLKTSSSPMWHYNLGLEHVLGSSSIFNGQHPAMAIGGSDAGRLASQTHAFPPSFDVPFFQRCTNVSPSDVHANWDYQNSVRAFV
ncbi:hypothetical protein DL96DRAFT_1551508 [Flagelloscypha sp. PMI_526]|nr:hypothetical protein DL96DRAFT_1551508 [Flagelloscypha sp. PMI_526]